MAHSQNFTTVDEQIELLKSRHLIVDSVDATKSLLVNYGYYSIVNGYKDSYVYLKDDKEFYKDGVTFERIYSLFFLDRSIRNQLMITMLDLEEHLKSVTSYVIGKAFGSNQSDYLKFSNYQNRTVSAKQFSLSEILKTMEKTSLSNKNPIKHHRDTYRNVPPWVLFKGIYLSTLVNFIRLQKPEQKISIICEFYSIPYDAVNGYVKDLFTDTLYMCLEYRNLAAHGGRIYNHIPNSKIRITNESETYLNSIIHNFSILKGTHSLGTLVCIFDLFNKKTYRDNLRQIIQLEITRHCENYPQDMDYLMTSIGVNNIAHSTRT